MPRVGTVRVKNALSFVTIVTLQKVVGKSLREKLAALKGNKICCVVRKIFFPRWGAITRRLSVLGRIGYQKHFESLAIYFESCKKFF